MDGNRGWDEEQGDSVERFCTKICVCGVSRQVTGKAWFIR